MMRYRVGVDMPVVVPQYETLQVFHDSLQGLLLYVDGKLMRHDVVVSLRSGACKKNYQKLCRKKIEDLWCEMAE